MDILNSEAILDESLIQIEEEELKQFEIRLESYDSEEKEVYRKRFNRHLPDNIGNSTKDKQLAAIEEDKYEQTHDKENENPTEPIIEEEEVETVKKESKSGIINPFLRDPNQQKADTFTKNEADFEQEYFPSTTVFNMSTNVILKMLQHPSFDMIKFALSKIPQMIRLADKNKGERSSNIFRVISACLSIKFNDRDRRIYFYKLVQDQLSVIQRDCAVEISEQSCPDFYTFLGHLRVFYEDYNLEIRESGIKTMRYFLQEYVDFLHSQKENRSKILKQNTFLHQLFKDLFGLAAEVVEEIRFIATDALMVIIDEFLPSAPIVKGDAYNNDLSDFRKNLSKTLENSEKMERIDQFTKLEAGMVKYVYDDPALFMQGIVKLAIDENNGANKDRLLQIITKMNEKLPFTVIQDFKRANSLGMFKRIELMKDIVVPK